jgi:hypothetical protein
MADQSDEQSWRPILLALAVLAAAGWLASGFIWWQGGQTQSYLTEQLAAAERARQSLASDLQNLEKTAGAAADLKKQAADAEKALSDASTARASAQNELADLTKQIGDARLAISGAQEERGDRRAQRPSRANSRGEVTNGLEPESVTRQFDHKVNEVHGRLCGSAPRV